MNEFDQKAETFRTQALQAGYSSEEVDFYVQKKKTDQSLQGKIGKFLPAAAGLATGIAARALPPGIRGAIVGGGIASGQRAEKMLRGEAPKEAYQFGLAGRGITGKEVKTIGISAATDLALTAVLKTLRTLWSPLKTIGQARGKIIGGQTTPTASLEEGALKNLQSVKEYQQATTGIQQAAKERLSHFLRTVNPWQTTGKGAMTTAQGVENIGINKLYENLPAFEKVGGAYGRSGELATGTKLASQAIRGYISGEVPKAAVGLNTLYGALASKEPYINWLLRGAMGGTGATLAGRALWNMGR